MSIVVEPDNPGNTHDLSFFINGRKWGIKLAQGARSVQELPSQPSNILINAKGRRTGDYDPSHGHEEIRTWEDGRGIEFHTDDNTRYFDSLNAWTLTPGLWHQAPQWTWGHAYHQTDAYMPGALKYNLSGSVRWLRLTSTAHHARSFVNPGSSNYTMAEVMLWVRRVGRPADLSVRFTSSGSGRPLSSNSSGVNTLSATSIEEYVSVPKIISLSTGILQSTAATYWMETWTTAAGNRGNYWELGYGTTDGVGSSSMQSSNGSSGTWAASTNHIYFKAASARYQRKWHFFDLDGATYAVDEPDDGTAGALFLNGDRGKASSGGSTAVLNDASKSWETALWSYGPGAVVAIIRGTGAGQKSRISSNTSTSLESTWAIAPTSDSEYVIYDSEEWLIQSTALWSSIGGHPVKDVAVANNIAYFAFGNSTTIGKLRWNSSVHEGAKSNVAGSSIADKLDFFQDAANGPSIWRGLSSAGEVSHASIEGFSTGLTFSSGIAVGDNTYAITNLEDHDGAMHVFKEDSIWRVQDDVGMKLNVGLDGFTSSHTGAAVLSQNNFLFMSWSYSLERMYGNTLDDIGLWKDGGLPSGRQGPVAALAPITAWTALGIDAGTTGRGSVQLWNGFGYHEIFRAWDAGYAVDNLHYQSNAGGRPRLWISVGGDLVNIQFPLNTLNPRNDGGINYQHEGHVIAGTIDMASMQLPKLFSEVHAITKNLASTTAEIATEYQLDDDIGSTFWLPIGSFLRSPADVLSINRGDKRAIRLRFRALTQTSTTPTEMHAATLKSVGRTPVKRQWNIRAEVGSFQVDAQGFPDADPDDFYNALVKATQTAVPIHLGSRWKSMHGINVYAEMPSIRRTYSTPDGKWGALFNMTVREV